MTSIPAVKEPGRELERYGGIGIAAKAIRFPEYSEGPEGKHFAWGN